MAKIYSCILGVLLLCSCHGDRVPAPGVSPAQDSLQEEKIKDSARKDIPVQVDTTFADTAKVLPIVAITITKKQEDAAPVVQIITQPTLTEIYTAYIGVREATGKNDGPAVERFLKNVGLGKGFPWCAAFVKTCLLEAGIKSAGKINGMALSCENKTHFVYTGKQLVGIPRAGDVGTLFYAKLGRIGHTFFYDKKVNSSIYESVEGNTNGDGSREGDGVYRKKRSLNATWSLSRWE